MACADGIQECIEIVRDLKANNYRRSSSKRLGSKIKAVEKCTMTSELSITVIVVSIRLIQDETLMVIAHCIGTVAFAYKLLYYRKKKWWRKVLL